ncbi:MAG: hypothetical protein KKF50_00560 [Nanoarchaeota archaeon]|nr:hypothetical protein [Nanoarchaeota archaeon]
MENNKEKINTNKKTARIFEDIKINVKLKISALWIAMLFLFAYVDIFGFYRPGIIDEIRSGIVAGMQITQGFLIFGTVYILIPSLMVFLSLTLKPTINRWTNIILALLYASSIVFFCIGETWVFYIFGSIVEVLLLLSIVWYAWKWPYVKNSGV